jgi:AraC family transcriptional regulator
MKLTTREDYLDRIRRVLRFVQQHLDEPLAPARLAGVAALSPFHFHRIFSAIVGESLGAHVRRLRLERAAGELRRTDREVIDIALGAGYEAHEPFTRAFRDYFGMPPTAFRRLAGDMTFPPVLCGVHYGADEAVSRFVPLQEGTKMIEVRLQTQPRRQVLALAHQGEYLNIGSTFGRLMQEAGSRGLLGPGSLSLGIYYDDPDTTAASELRAHACVTVADSVREAPPGFELLTIEAGEFAVGVHRGPYSALKDSYRWLFGQWLPSSGRDPAHAPCFELYVNDPQATPETELITEIHVPLAAAAVPA